MVMVTAEPAATAEPAMMEVEVAVTWWQRWCGAAASTGAAGRPPCIPKNVLAFPKYGATPSR